MTLLMIRSTIFRQMLADAEPGLRPLYEGCKKNREDWERLQQEHDKLSEWIDANVSFFPFQ